MEVFKKCFADNGENCTALKKKDCKKCKFYRTDLKKSEIEWDIYKYGGTGNEDI